MTRRLAGALAAVTVAVAVTAACQSAPSAAPSGSTIAPATTSALAHAQPAAAAELAGLSIKGAGAATGYSRLRFGPAWPRLEGCDSRNRVLDRDLTTTVLRAGGCVVLSGTLVSPYTRVVIHFLRGPQSAQAQIDHVVALGDAWQTGAQGWSAAKRETFANDPAELLAVDGPSNEAKGDSDAASWLPPNKAFRCAYAKIQIAVKAKYGLWVTQAEHDALATQLTRC